MKKFVFSSVLMMLTLCVNNSNAQSNVKREGNTFTQVSNRQSHKADTLVTTYIYADSNGKKYPIIINKTSGACYVWKLSRNNKNYRQYMKPEVTEQICRELNIEYKPRTRR